MEIVIWKHKIKYVVVWGYNCLTFLVSVILALISIYNVNLGLLAISFFIFFIIGICWFFLDKNILSKLTFSEQGIRWTRFNKEVMYIKWIDITNIKQTPDGLATFYLTFVSNDKCINMDIASKKMYKQILDICPNENIKFMIKNIDFLRNYNKKN